jgi:hypothetical protein
MRDTEQHVEVPYVPLACFNLRNVRLIHAQQWGKVGLTDSMCLAMLSENFGQSTRIDFEGRSHPGRQPV